MAAKVQRVQTQQFALPVTNMNLAPSEALNQIIDNLNHLNMIVNQAVNTIQSRIQQESELLTSISHRVQQAYQKTSHIASIPSKATTVYSLSTYPEVQSHSVMDRCPLINKTPTHSSPIKPKRSNYNLSLRQRNEPPTHVNTVRLLHSINTKTQPKPSKPDHLQDMDIPSWVSSVSDCLIFGTNCGAYKPFKDCTYSSDHTKRRRYQRRKRSRRRDTALNNNDSMTTAPPSIGDRYYNAKAERQPYGERIKYRCVLDRENMPKFKADWNVFDDVKDIKVVQDIQWKNDDAGEQGFIPSDVLNNMDIPFEYGDAVDPPTCARHEVNSDTNIKPMKRETDANVICDSEPIKDNVVNAMNEEICQEEQVERKQTEQMQPLIIEDDAQNKSLQMQNEDVDVEIDIESDEDDEVDAETTKPVNRIDDNALENAIARLKPSTKIKEENGSGAGGLFAEIEKRRQYYTDTEDEDDSSLFQ
eukprot:210339_1